MKSSHYTQLGFRAVRTHERGLDYRVAMRHSAQILAKLWNDEVIQELSDLEHLYPHRSEGSRRFLTSSTQLRRYQINSIKGF